MTPLATATSFGDDATLLQGFRWVWKRRRVTHLIYLVVGLLSLGRGVAILLGEGGTSNPLGWLFLMGGVYCLIRKLVHTRSFQSAVKRMPLYGKEIVWNFSEDMLELVSEQAFSHLKWEAVYETCITPEGFLIYVERGIFFWVPRSAFADADAPANVEALLKRKTKCVAIH